MSSESQKFYEVLKAKLIKESGLGTEYSISPGDFQSLLSVERVQEALMKWFKVSVHESDGKNTAIFPNGEEANFDDLYIEIESDPKMRFEMYQIGMSIWR